MPAYPVARVGEIPEGGRKIVEVAGRSIGIFNLQGTYHAIRNRCPHQGGPLCMGVISGFVQSSRPGQYQYTRRGEFLRCPWHGWEFEIATGQSWFDPARVRVRSYEVALARGDALLTEASAGLQPGPYLAETYPIVVDAEYILVRIER